MVRICGALKPCSYIVAHIYTLKDLSGAYPFILCTRNLHLHL